MENIILTNNKDLRLVGVKVGVLSTLRLELPLVSASATHVEVIVTSGDVHSAYTATFISDAKCWQCDIAASQFPAVGKQSYEIAYVLDGKQFWDGKGWIEIEDATTSGIEPEPRPEPYRYAVVSVNGYGADAQGAVRIPKTFVATNSPVTTEGYMEGDIYFNRETGATWTLCNVQSTLTWVFNYKNYYTKAETEEAIDRVAAYYITYDAAGNPFPTYASLANAQTVYSGGKVRTPTRNDYCVVLADETHDNAEYRYIYAVAEGQTTGSWQPQFPVEGVMTVDQTVQKNSQNPVSGGGVWSAIWGALASLPAGFSSLYDWCVSQLAGKASTADATLTERGPNHDGFSAWTIFRDGVDVTEQVIEMPRWHENVGWVVLSAFIPGDRDGQDVVDDGPDALYLKWTCFREGEGIELVYTATRTALPGYQLGSQSDRPLASEAEAEALRQGKLNNTTDTMSGNLTVRGSLTVGSRVDGSIIGTNSVAEGGGVKASGNTSHAEGSVTTASGNYSHAEGWDTTASGRDSHAEGYGTTASGQDSHAEGGSTTAQNKAEHAQGRFNDSHKASDTIGDAGNTLSSIGFGTDSSDRKNAVETMQDGKTYIYGLSGYDGTNPTATGVKDLAAAVNGKANVSAIPYSLGTPIVIDSSSVQTDNTDPNNPITYATVTLLNRTANIVQVTAATALDELRITFPAATSGKVRDFGLRVEIGTGSAALAAPALVPIAPTGETIKIENADRAIPELADGTATAKGVTLLYFSENAPGVFVVKGEQVEEVA